MKNKCRHTALFCTAAEMKSVGYCVLLSLYHCLETLIVGVDPAGQDALNRGKKR